MSKNDSTHVFLRLSADARPSSIDLRAVDLLFGRAGAVALLPDARDHAVYFFEIPANTDKATRRKVLDALANQASVDDVWHGPLAVKGQAPAASGRHIVTSREP